MFRMACQSCGNESQIPASGSEVADSDGDKVPNTDPEGGGNSKHGGKSYVDAYKEEWEQLFSKEVNIDELRRKSLDGELKSSHFRSICWRCMLGVLHNEPDQWLLELKTHRTHYRDLWIELKKNPWNVEKNPSDNPLSQEEESIWQKYFSNEELKSIIHQDVVRTSPGVPFFERDYIEDIMVRILFCYARQNPSLSYRQGMHEILGPLMYVLFCDYQALELAKEQNMVNSVLFEILDPDYIEEDSYSIFKHVMNHIECSYRFKTDAPRTSGHLTAKTDDDESCENEVLSKLQFIKENILKVSDPDLNKYLDDLDIPLPIFGVRWLRLLFGREFPFQDLLVLWDAIFAVTNFELVNFVVVAMLTAIRGILLVGDYTTCLKNLIHYPSGVDVMFVIKYALHLMNPSSYPVPVVTSFVDKPVTLLSEVKPRIRTMQSSKSNDSALAPTERLKTLPSRSNKRLPGKSFSTVIGSSGEGDGNTQESLTSNNLDVEHLISTIGFVQTKLSQYYNVLHCHLSDTSSSEVKSALRGIYEAYAAVYLQMNVKFDSPETALKSVNHAIPPPLCSLLKKYQAQSSCSDIEPALEAWEYRRFVSAIKKTSAIRRTVKQVSPEMKANTLPKVVKQLPPQELHVFQQYQCGSVVGVPMVDPLRLLRKIYKNEEDKSNLEDEVD